LEETRVEKGTPSLKRRKGENFIQLLRKALRVGDWKIRIIVLDIVSLRCLLNPKIWILTYPETFGLERRYVPVLWEVAS
jgi:hypothetical protein